VRLGTVRWGIEAFIERNLFSKRELAAATALPVQAKTAALVGAPLTVTAVRAGVFFGGVFSHSVVGDDYFSTSVMAAFTACSVI